MTGGRVGSYARSTGGVPRPQATDLRDGDGAYVNFLGDEGLDRVQEAHPGPTWDRLVAIKRRYDPSNLFRLNQNVPPGDIMGD